MTCAVIQASFIPWRGYFHQIQKAECFVFYDDVQYDKHGWRNRNRIKTAQGAQWLTVPVLARGVVSEHLPICEVLIDWKTNWLRKHLAAVKQSYGRAPFFSEYFPILEKAYEIRPERLVDLTIPLTVELAAALGIR
ncbi:MAG: WbqC family protein, partial [Verrucomicrobiaceae bacterium]